MWAGIVVGIAIAGLNGLGAWLILWWALKKNPVRFIQIFFGGMVGRLVLVGAASFLVLKFTSVHRAGYVGGLMGFYLLFLIAEVIFIHRQAVMSG